MPDFIQAEISDYTEGFFDCDLFNAEEIAMICANERIEK